MKLVPKTAIYLCSVSFLTDLSSETIYSVLPILLSSVQGRKAVIPGVIEGIAESAAAFLKIVSGL